MKNLSVKFKILIYAGLFGMACIFAMSIISIRYVDKILTKSAKDHLLSVQNTKKMQVEQFIFNKINVVQSLANMPVTVRAINKLIMLSQAPADKRQLAASEMDVYSKSFTAYMKTNGLSNIVIANAKEGVILYNENSPPTHPIFLINEDNMLSKAWKKCLGNREAIVSDFESSSINNSSSFYIASPVISKGEIIAVLIAKVSSTEISKITMTTVGMGQTGETYIVGDDFLMRTESKFAKGSSILIQEVKTDAVKRAKEGNFGTDFIVDYRNREVMSSYEKLRIPGLDWIIVSEIDEFEVMTPKRILSNTILIVCLIIFILMMPILYLIGLSISRPLKKQVEYALKLADGELDATINIHQKDEIGILADALRTFANKTKSVIISVMEATGNLADAGTQLSASSQSLSTGASQQASSIQEISASMEEMSSNIQHNSDNAGQTEELSISVDEQVRDGSKVILFSVGSMEKIAEKVSIISDIAFQTNILALNASVEAARAGEYGKGFGVVASEVGKLADKIKTAAAEINEISRVSVDVAANAKEIINQLVPSIQNTSILVREIAAASKEQRDASNQINNAIQILNDVSQQNAAAAEEIATNSEELSSQADQLINVVKHFKISDFSLNKKKSLSSKKLIEEKSKFFEPKSVNTGININLDSNDDLDDEFERF